MFINHNHDYVFLMQNIKYVSKKSPMTKIQKTKSAGTNPPKFRPEKYQRENTEYPCLKMVKYIKISKAQEKNKILRDKTRQNKRIILQSEKCSH